MVVKARDERNDLGYSDCWRTKKELILVPDRAVISGEN